MTRFGHSDEPVADFCKEVSLLEGAQIGTVDTRIQNAMEFRVGGNAAAVDAKVRLRAVARAHGFHVGGEIAYAGQPLARAALASPGNQ